MLCSPEIEPHGSDSAFLALIFSLKRRSDEIRCCLCCALFLENIDCHRFFLSQQYLTDTMENFTDFVDDNNNGWNELNRTRTCLAWLVIQLNSFSFSTCLQWFVLRWVMTWEVLLISCDQTSIYHTHNIITQCYHANWMLYLAYYYSFFFIQKSTMNWTKCNA